MDLRLKKHRKQYFIVISYPGSRDYCVPVPHVHGQEIFKTLFERSALTRPAVPEVHIIRGFEQYSGQAAEEDYLCIDGAMIECMPADAFVISCNIGFLSVSFDPWDKHTDNWADRPEEYEDVFLSHGLFSGHAQDK